MMAAIIHSADLSNPGKPFHQASLWGRRISEEFKNQVTEEAKRGMPITPFMMGLEKDI